jgi:hypothetical protein
VIVGYRSDVRFSNLRLAVFAKGRKTHVYADAVPERRQPGIIEAPGSDNRLVFVAHRFGERKDEFLLASVVLIPAVRLQARWRRAGDEVFSVGPDNVAENLDLPLEACFSAASISSALLPAALTAEAKSRA